MAEASNEIADLEELEELLSAAKRPRVQGLLRQEIEALKKVNIQSLHLNRDSLLVDSRLLSSVAFWSSAHRKSCLLEAIGVRTVPSLNQLAHPSVIVEEVIISHASALILPHVNVSYVRNNVSHVREACRIFFLSLILSTVHFEM